MDLQHTYTVAITGASGLMGRRIVPALLRSGANVRMLVRGSEVQPQPGCTPVRGDLSDAGSLNDLLKGADALVHLAGIAHTDLRSPKERERAFAVNVTGTANLFTAARQAGVGRIVLMSSAHVYAGRRGVGLPESAPTGGDGGYADMKLQAEELARQLQEDGRAVAILRPCLTYGAGVRFNLHDLMRAIKRRLYVHPAGADAVRSFASVDTVAAAVLHMLQPAVPGGTYNLADREAASLRQWVDHLAILLGAAPPHAVPVGVLRGAAALGTALVKFGLPAPLTGKKLDKLTAPFSLDISALRATGFLWPETTEDVLRKMTQVFLQSTATPEGASR